MPSHKQALSTLGKRAYDHFFRTDQQKVFFGARKAY
jgi:hypothetical protein